MPPGTWSLILVSNCREVDEGGMEGDGVLVSLVGLSVSLVGNIVGRLVERGAGNGVGLGTWL